jgi:hypothetical protein
MHVVRAETTLHNLQFSSSVDVVAVDGTYGGLILSFGSFRRWWHKAEAYPRWCIRWVLILEQGMTRRICSVFGGSKLFVSDMY